MEPTTTAMIVDVLTPTIGRHRLRPGAKLAEQQLADHFRDSRTLVRQALRQLSHKRLIAFPPAQGSQHGVEPRFGKLTCLTFPTTAPPFTHVT